MSIELQKKIADCPWCCCEATLEEKHWWSFVECADDRTDMNCGAHGPGMRDPAEAVTEWNRVAELVRVGQIQKTRYQILPEDK